MDITLTDPIRAGKCYAHIMTARRCEERLNAGIDGAYMLILVDMGLDTGEFLPISCATFPRLVEWLHLAKPVHIRVEVGEGENLQRLQELLPPPWPRDELLQELMMANLDARIALEKMKGA